MAELSDRVLWERTKQGDSGAFGALFDRYADTVYGYCFRRTGDWALAEDITSIVFLEAWRKRHSVDLYEGKALPWLLGIGTNVIRNQRRSLRRFRAMLERLPRLDPVSDFGDNLDERISSSNRMRALLKEIRRLPRREQDVVTLCIWHGLSSSEAAAALAVPEATVRTRLHRARARLRKHTIDNSDRRDIIAEGVEPR
jgi:RNA polymerase sigma factor (sigma-70 family)